MAGSRLWVSTVAEVQLTVTMSRAAAASSSRKGRKCGPIMPTLFTSTPMSATPALASSDTAVSAAAVSVKSTTTTLASTP